MVHALSFKTNLSSRHFFYDQLLFQRQKILLFVMLVLKLSAKLLLAFRRSKHPDQKRDSLKKLFGEGDRYQRGAGLPLFHSQKRKEVGFAKF